MSLATIKLICLLMIGVSVLQAKQPSLFITEDFQKAQRLSIENGLPIALIFTGSDWSLESEEFLSEWLFHSEKAKMLRHKLIFAWIDFPELNMRPINLVELDHQLKDRFQVKNFPTIILIDPAGQEITRLGYPLAGELNFATLTKEKLLLYSHLIKKWEKVKETQDEERLFSAYQDALTLGCNFLLDDMIAFATQQQICLPLLFERYAALANAGEKNKPEARQLRQILLRRDPSNKKGMRERLALFDFQQQNNAFLLETVLQQFSSHESENFWRIHLVLSEHFFHKGKTNEALEHAQIAYRYAPALKKEDVSKIIDQIFQKKP